MKGRAGSSRLREGPPDRAAPPVGLAALPGGGFGPFVWRMVASETGAGVERLPTAPIAAMTVAPGAARWAGQVERRHEASSPP